MEPARHTLFITWPPGVRDRKSQAYPEDNRVAEMPDGTAEERWTYRDLGYARQWADYYRGMGATVRLMSE